MKWWFERCDFDLPMYFFWLHLSVDRLFGHNENFFDFVGHFVQCPNCDIRDVIGSTTLASDDKGAMHRFR